jgi:hypothetical protein
MVDTERFESGGTDTDGPVESSAGNRQQTARPTRRRLTAVVVAAAAAALFAVAMGTLGVAAATTDVEPTSGHNTTVTVVSDNGTGWGEETAALLERGVDLEETPLSVSVVDSTDVDETLIDETDAFVFHYVDGEVAGEVIPAVENDTDTHAVYVEQYDLATTNALFQRADAVNDPNFVQRASDSGEANNVSFEIQTDHPIFEGVGEQGDTVLIHQEADSDRVHFTGADGETLAEVGIEGAEPDGPVAAVDPESEAVLLGTIAPHPAQNESAFTDQAAQILGNAVLFGVETEPPSVALSNLSIAGQGSDALVYDRPGNVSLTVSHVGGGAGQVDVTLGIGETTVTQTVQVDVGGTVAVTFENATSELSPGSYNVTVSVDGDLLTGSLLRSVDATGNGEPATDTTDDGLLNNVDGDETFNIFDVQALFNELESTAVQNNPGLFDFDDDDPPEVNIFDVQALFGQI